MKDCCHDNCLQVFSQSGSNCLCFDRDFELRVNLMPIETSLARLEYKYHQLIA